MTNELFLPEPDKKIVFAVDIDGVLCESSDDYSDEALYARKPIQENIDKINSLYFKQNIIIIYTARNPLKQMVTEAWLRKVGVRFHAVRCGKLWFNQYVDEDSKLLAIEKVK